LLAGAFAFQANCFVAVFAPTHRAPTATLLVGPLWERLGYPCLTRLGSGADAALDDPGQVGLREWL